MSSEEKKEKKKEKKEKKEKSTSKKGKSVNKNDSIDLLISIDANNHKRSESDYNELLSPDHEQNPTIVNNNTNSNEVVNAKIVKVSN